MGFIMKIFSLFTPPSLYYNSLPFNAFLTTSSKQMTLLQEPPLPRQHIFFRKQELGSLLYGDDVKLDIFHLKIVHLLPGK